MILPLEKQVCNRELSQKLKELGVPQESVFYWGPDLADRWSLFYCQQFDIDGLEGQADPTVAAFTVAELYKIQSNIDPHFTFPSGIEPEQLADYIAEEICKTLSQ